MNSLSKASETALKICLGLKKDERVLIMYVNKKKKIAYSLFKEAQKITKDCSLLKIKAPKVNGEEPSKKVAKEMLKDDVIMLVTSKS